MLQNPASGNESFDQQPALSLPLVCHWDGYSDITIEKNRDSRNEDTGYCNTGGETGKDFKPPDTENNRR